MFILGGYNKKTEKKDMVKEEMILESEDNEMRLKIDETDVEVLWQDNDAVKQLRKIVKDKPLEIKMSKYGGFEQVGYLGFELPDEDNQISTNSGDIMLYNGNNIVIFYGSNSWAYTRLGKITDKDEKQLNELLSDHDVMLTIY